MCYKHISNLPPKAVLKLKGKMEKLSIYLVLDSNLKIMEEIESFGEELFGELGMNRWGVIPQIRHGNVFVVKESPTSEIVGLAIFMRDFNNIEESYLFDFAIASEQQGKNLGYHFMKQIADYYRESNFTIISLMCDTNNHNAIKLYRDKLNFKLFDTHENEYGEGIHRHIYKLNLLE